MAEDSKTTTSPDANNKRVAEVPELISASKKLRSLAGEKQSSEANNNSNDDSSNKDTDSSPEKEDNDKNAEERSLSFALDADAAEDKGSRHTMEDAWVVIQDASLDFPGKLRCAHFAIYDGHGGRLAAEYAKKNLHRNVLSAGLPLGR